VAKCLIAHAEGIAGQVEIEKVMKGRLRQDATHVYPRAVVDTGSR
jgi:hypothetical protein